MDNSKYPAPQALSAAMRALLDEPGDYDQLIESVGQARVVLLGEATHGSHEFYRERARITRRLIEERGFNAVAAEADWPDAYAIHEYVTGFGDREDAAAPLLQFMRFPRWMWANTDVVKFVRWLRGWNDSKSETQKASFYGLDLYSLYASIHSALFYLAKTDPEAEKRARYRYSCLEHFGEDPQNYGYSSGFGLTESCEKEVVRQLSELQQKMFDYLRRDGHVALEEYFSAEQNARVVKNAEQYYRTMFQGDAVSWNVRDRHMAETLQAIYTHLQRKGIEPRIVVWEHNSHVGDARATQMGGSGELNVGQLARETWGDDARLIGFTTYSGTVTAASEWDGPAERKTVRPALPGSCEDLFHRTGVPRFILDLKHEELQKTLGEMLERAIGVIYLPQSERLSHYFYARLPEQFDAVVHIDETEAVKPLEGEQRRVLEEEVPETYPSGF